MNKNSKSAPLTEVLDDLDKDEKNGRILLGDMIDRLSSRGFGPFMIAAGCFTILPTGALPGASAVIAALTILIAGQILFGRTTPWLPSRVKKISFPASAITKGKKKIMPTVKRIDALVRPRLAVMSSGPATRIVAGLCILIALSLPFLGLIPFALIPPGLAFIFLGLGLSAHDGLLILLAFAITGAGLIAGLLLGIFN